MKPRIAIIIPNWNGKDRLKLCLDSVLVQSLQPDEIIVIENGSTDSSYEYLKKSYPKVTIIRHKKNLGFAGGVNSGLKQLIDREFDMVGLLNNDAVIDKEWLKIASRELKNNNDLGAVAGRILSFDKKTVDSTGDFYTTWGLPFNRDRDVAADKATSKPGYVFGPCAGAALYNIAAIKDVGMLDEDFFAYHEDADLHFRLQLRGWKTYYNPSMVAYHATGSTSKTLPGFTTYQTFKNFPLLLWKNVPLGLLPSVLPRFIISYSSIYLNSLVSGKAWPATKGLVMSLLLLPKKLIQRIEIQNGRKLTSKQISEILVHDLPPNATRLRKLRSIFTDR